jgi:enoyl-CoA hydratase
MTTEAVASEFVSLERRDAVGIIRLSRPAARNAISAVMAEAIEGYVAAVEADRTIRVGIIAAEGPVFCAGADLKDVAAGKATQLMRPLTGFAGFVYAPRAKPWIAAVQGPAHGGGLEIALSCDMIVASTAANFALPEVKRGIIAGASGAYRIARSLPRVIAAEMVTTGLPLDATRAFAAGLVNRLVAPEDLLEATLELAAAVAANSPLSVRESLAVTRRAASGDEAMFRGLEAQAIARVMNGPDAIEGATAFVEKRAPVWKS